MKLEKKHYYWIGAAALVTAIGVVVYKKRKRAKAELALTNGKSTAQIGTDNSAPNGSLLEAMAEESSPFPIKIGAKGDAVKAIQKYMNSTCPSDLKAVGIYPLEINGVWDDKMDKATLACSVLKRNEIDKVSFDRILRDLQSANISV